MPAPFIYLDNNATTPIDPRVLEEMMPYLTTAYANAGSSHGFGLQIKKAVEQARGQVAKLIGAFAREIVFTSGATESINLALKGVAQTRIKKGYHIITVATEHKAVLDTCKYLETIGYEVDYLPVKSDGTLDLNVLKTHLRDDTILVAVMLVNNETGIIQFIEHIASMVHQSGALFFTDVTQGFGKLPIDVERMQIDMLAFSGHKIYSPKGIGGLYVKSGVPLMTLLHGGGHEQNLRSGTLNVSGIVGLGKAAELAGQDMEGDRRRIGRLRDNLENALLTIEGAEINGSINQKIYNTTNIRFEGIHADILIKALDTICVSSGSACSSSIPQPSYVLEAMGLTQNQAFSSIRFSLGRFTTDEEVEIAIETVKNLVAFVRQSSYQNT